jgi:hypothetical protein
MTQPAIAAAVLSQLNEMEELDRLIYRRGSLFLAQFSFVTILKNGFVTPLDVRRSIAISYLLLGSPGDVRA